MFIVLTIIVETQGRIKDLWLGGAKTQNQVFFWSDKNGVVGSKLSFK
jgi:hypothetical protein